jgi:pyruvate kinase
MWGVSADTVKPISDPEKIIAHTLQKLRRDGSLRKGDRVVCVFGSPIWAPGTRTNTVRVATA